MFRLFDNLVDPYANYKETDAPPQEIWLLGYLVVW